MSPEGCCAEAMKAKHSPIVQDLKISEKIKVFFSTSIYFLSPWLAVLALCYWQAWSVSELNLLILPKLPQSPEAWDILSVGLSCAILLWIYSFFFTYRITSKLKAKKSLWANILPALGASLATTGLLACLYGCLHLSKILGWT